MNKKSQLTAETFYFICISHCRKKEAPRPLCIRTGCLYMMLENVSNLNRVGAMN